MNKFVKYLKENKIQLNPFRLLFEQEKEENTPQEYTASGRLKRKTATTITYKEEEDDGDIDMNSLFKEIEEQEQRFVESDDKLLSWLIK